MFQLIIEYKCDVGEIIVNELSIIIIVHNQKEILINQIKLLKIFNNIDSKNITIVDNYSSDGLKEFLEAQNEYNYVICDKHIENFSFIINTCIREFAHDSDFLILNPGAILLPGSLNILLDNLNPKKGIYTVTPCSLYYGDKDIHSIEDAIIYSDNRKSLKGLECVMKPNDITVLISKELLSDDKPFDDNIASYKTSYSDFFIRAILNDRFLYNVNNAFQYVISPYNDYYEKILGKDYDSGYIRNKWHMNYLNMGPNYNLIQEIKEASDKSFNVLEVGCDCGATLLEIHNRFPESSVYGVEINAVSANIASHIANIKVGNIEESVDLWNNIKFDYIIFGDVLEHLHNPDKVVKECLSILNSNGKIISSIPNLMHYSVLYKLINGNFTYTDTGLLDRTHIHFFTYNEIINMFENNGYKIISAKGISNINKNSKQIKDFIDAITELSNHEQREFFEVYQYVTVSQKLN